MLLRYVVVKVRQVSNTPVSLYKHTEEKDIQWENTFLFGGIFCLFIMYTMDSPFFQGCFRQRRTLYRHAKVKESMQQRYLSSLGSTTEFPTPIHLGAHLRLLRDRHGLSQTEIVNQLPGWQQAAYSRIEKGTRAPMFENLLHIWRALKLAGVQLTWQDRELFLVLARDMLESRKTRHTRRSAEEWNALRDQLAAIDGVPLLRGEAPLARRPQQRQDRQRPRREVGHLLGREQWLAEVVEMIGRSSVKVLVLQGPPGCGKTSELHRLAHHFFPLSHYQVVLSEPAPIQVERLEPTDVLDQLLGDAYSVIASAYGAMPTTNFEARIKDSLQCLAKADHPVLIFLDNAEHIFDAQGHLATIWQRFLAQFLQGSHQATLVLASQEWPAGTYLQESQLVKTISVPRLSRTEGSQLLQVLGIRNVSEELLGRAVDVVEGLPICLEWIVKLIQEPLLRDEWSDFEDEGNERIILERLLEDPALFGGPVARRVQPLLERVLGRLSVEATTALQELAMAPLPLGAPALRVLYQSPRHLKELREASLLVSYPQRVQLLPMVASQVRQGLSEGQRHAAEERLIQALMHWLHTDGMVYEHEAGEVVAELSLLLLARVRLLEAAQVLIRYGWLAFHLGQSQRIGRLIYQIIEAGAWQPTDEHTCGRIILEHFFAPFVGREKDTVRCEQEYRTALALLHEGRIAGHPSLELHLVHHLILSAVNKHRFEDAQYLFQKSYQRLAPQFAADADIHASLLERKAFFLGRWSTWAAEHGQPEMARELFDQTLLAYRECCTLLSATQEGLSRIEYGRRQKRLARVLNGLGHRLNLIGQFQEALHVIDQSIVLKEQGYAEYGALAASHGEKAQALAGLGRYQEALLFSDNASNEIRRLIQAGDRSAEEEQWVYAVERANILWQLARPDEAERLVQEARQHIHERRSEFRVMAQHIEDDIHLWRRTVGTAPCQLDWRWIGVYRQLVAYPLYDWLKPAGPLRAEEEAQLHHLLQQHTDEALQQSQALMACSLERELDQTIEEQRNPRLCYPALPLDRVRTLMVDLRELDERMLQQEINSVVRDWYHQAIQEELAILSLVEATAVGDGMRYWQTMRELYPPPTEQEQRYVLSRIGHVLAQGMLKEETAELAREVAHLLTEQQLAIDVSLRSGEAEESAQDQPSSISGSRPRMVRAQVAKRFIETLFERHGWTDWHVVIDPTAQHSYVDAASRRLVLLSGELSITQVLWLYEHEVQDHVQSAVTGELSRLGLLALGLPGYAPYREGCALYTQREAAEAGGKPFDESAVWVGTFGILLAVQIGGHPRAFYQLFRCLERFFLLYRLLRRPDQSKEEAEAKARDMAVSRCLRLFRGKPNLAVEGCWTKDVIYQRGLALVEQVVKEDSSILSYLSLGKMAREHLPLLQELQILPTLPASGQNVMSEEELEALLVSFEREA